MNIIKAFLRCLWMDFVFEEPKKGSEEHRKFCRDHGIVSVDGYGRVIDDYQDEEPQLSRKVVWSKRSHKERQEYTRPRTYRKDKTDG